ncbi:MAG: hypothetical protein ABJE95_10490 [Byssovorax sp.]
MRRSLLPLLVGALASSVYACAAGTQIPTGATTTEGAGGFGGAAAGTGSTGGAVATSTTATGPDDDDGGIVLSDATTEEKPIEMDAACAAVASEATATALPVDIIWLVDNSSSMQLAVDQIKLGLNAFAATIEATSLDYQVIMLALRSKQSPITVNGGTRYPVCIPQPLAGDDNCGDGTRFFQSSVDIYSIQPLEQFLGTMGQTKGYTAIDAKGGEPWAQHLRPNATKTIIVVSDDNARLSATDFETFAGGKNPYNSLTLPPGILDPSYNGLFTGYLFGGIYGWGNAADPSVKCTFADNTQPASSGPTYTTLVTKTGGVRAKLCDGAAAWQPFFDAVAQAVIASAKLSCELVIPPPSMGTLDPAKVNVAIQSNGNQVYLTGVADAAACGPTGGWYYDDPGNPTTVILCPASCDTAQASVGPGKPGHIEVLFGCSTIAQ